jgi:hypothetical protein
MPRGHLTRGITSLVWCWGWFCRVDSGAGYAGVPYPQVGPVEWQLQQKQREIQQLAAQVRALEGECQRRGSREGAKGKPNAHGCGGDAYQRNV